MILSTLALLAQATTPNAGASHWSVSHGHGARHGKELGL